MPYNTRLKSVSYIYWIAETGISMVVSKDRKIRTSLLFFHLGSQKFPCPDV